MEGVNVVFDAVNATKAISPLLPTGQALVIVNGGTATLSPLLITWPAAKAAVALVPTNDVSETMTLKLVTFAFNAPPAPPPVTGIGTVESGQFATFIQVAPGYRLLVTSTPNAANANSSVIRTVPPNLEIAFRILSIKLNHGGFEKGGVGP